MVNKEQAAAVAAHSDEELFARGFEIIAGMPNAVKAAQEDVLREWGLELDAKLVGGLLACGASLVFMIGKQAAQRALEQEGKSDER